MSLARLPLEIFRLVLVAAVESRGLVRGLRLRLVCKPFAHEIPDAILKSRVLLYSDSCRPQYHNFQYHESPLQKRYFQIAVLQSDLSTPLVNMIRKIAGDLCAKDGFGTNRNKVKQYTEKLSALAYSYTRSCLFVLLNEDQPPNNSVGFTDQPYEWHLLAAAAHMNSFSALKAILDNNLFQLEAKRSNLFGCPFEIAIYQDNLEFFEELLRQKGFKFPAEQQINLLSRTAGNRQVAIMHRTLQFGWDWWSPPFGYPLSEMIFDLLEHFKNTDVRGSDFQRVFNHYVERENLTMVEFLFARFPEAAEACWTQRWIHIDEAARKGFKSIVQNLLKRNRCTFGVVASAASGGHLDIVRLLVEHGCDVNESDGIKPPAIVYAILLEHTEMFKFLIEHGAEIDTPGIHTAVVEGAKVQGMESMLELLAQYGVRAGPPRDPETWALYGFRGCESCCARHYEQHQSFFAAWKISDGEEIDEAEGWYQSKFWYNTHLQEEGLRTGRWLASKASNIGVF